MEHLACAHSPCTRPASLGLCLLGPGSHHLPSSCAALYLLLRFCHTFTQGWWSMCSCHSQPSTGMTISVCFALLTQLPSSRLAPGECLVPVGSGWLASWLAEPMSVFWELCPECFSLLLAHSQQLFSHYFLLPSLYVLPFSLPFFPAFLTFLSVSLITAFLCSSSYLPFLLSFFLPSASPFPSLHFLTFPLHSSPLVPCPPSHALLQMEKLLFPAVDLEQWYQELMAGLGTGLAAASPRSSPPPLPAKTSRQLQVTFSITPPSLLLSVSGTSCQSISHTCHLR